MNVELPEEVFLAVNPKGVLIINPDTKAVLATYPYSEVPTWGHSGTSFVLNIGNLIKHTKLYLCVAGRGGGAGANTQLCSPRPPPQCNGAGQGDQRPGPQLRQPPPHSRDPACTSGGDVSGPLLRTSGSSDSE